MSDDKEARYLATLINPIKECASYLPKMGQGSDAGLTLEDFQKLYRADPFYTWYGLDHPLMYAAHKAAGGMTSVYRQIGKGVENLFRKILQDELGLSESQSKWSYELKVAGQKKPRILSLDGRIEFSDVSDEQKRKRVTEWLNQAASALSVDPNIISALKGVVFEVRQGYKSKDSKRQNADIANASTAYTKAYLPCLLVLSTQIDKDLVTRYQLEKWALLTGSTAEKSTIKSTYSFVRDVIGFDLADFLSRNSGTLKKEVETILTALLSTSNKEAQTI
jgi:hypothetical protein